MKIHTLIKQNLQFSFHLGTFLTHLRKPPMLTTSLTQIISDYVTHSTCLYLPSLEMRSTLVSFSSRAQAWAECVIAGFPFLIFSGGDVGGKRTYQGFLLNKSVIKSIVTDFKQVPVNGQNETTALGDWTETHQPPKFLYFSCLFSPAELKRSFHRIYDACGVEGLWHSKAKTLQQPPVPK